MKTKSPLFRIDRLLLAALALLAAPQANAQTTNTWTATSANGAWLSAGNWSPSNVPTSTTVARFTNTTAGVGVGINGNTSPGTNNTAGFLFIGNTSLTIINSSTTASAANTNSALRISGWVEGGQTNLIVNSSTSGQLRFSNNGSATATLGVMRLQLVSGGVINVSNSEASVVINGLIRDQESTTNTITKTGAGTLAIGGTNVNTFAGGVVLNAGVLQLNKSSALGAEGGLGLTINGGLLDNGSGGVITLSNYAQTWGGNFSFIGTTNLNLGAGAVNLTGTRTVTVTANALTVDGAITNTGGITKAGAGTLILNGANTYTGKTTINSGTVILSGSGTAGTIASDLEVAGGLLNLSAGTKTNAAFTLSGGTITNGTLQATSYALQGGTIISNATLGTGTATVTTGTTTLNGLLNAATLNVNSGTLTAGSAGRFTGAPTVTVSNGATLNLAGNEIFGSLAGAGSVSNSAGRITAGGNNTSTTFSGVLSGAGELTKTGIGRLSLSGSSSYNGATTVSAGELNLSGGSIASSAVTVASGASLSGYGSVGTIGGAGAINPGNSPGILTTPQVNPSGGTDFNLEMTGTAPTYNNAASSVNDVIRITGVTPFSEALVAGNGINIYFSGAALFTGSTAVQYQGGFFTDQSASFASSITNATYNYYFADAIGTNSYNGANYYTKAQYETAVLSSNLMTITVTTVAQTANFGSGDISGQVMQVQVIPEPSTYALLGLSAAAFGAYRWRRRHRG